jgi:hypothetical protein
MTSPGWMDEIPTRRLLDTAVEARLPLAIGDRPLVTVGDEVAAGDPVLERVTDAWISEVEVRTEADAKAPVSGDRWSSGPQGRRFRRGSQDLEGELLVPVARGGERWRLVTGEHRTVVTSPLRGTLSEVCPGSQIRIRAAGLALRGAIAAGVSTHGRLELATDPFGELRPGGIDVSRAGSILVVGSRIDAEALTRARAMGVHGVVVASLPGKERRDFTASEQRQRAALHPSLPFGVLALDGTLRRRIPTPVITLFERLAGRDVGLLVDPPSVVFDAGELDLPTISPAWVRVRSGPWAGAEGRAVGPAGRRRYGANVMLDAAWIAIDGESPVAIPLGDLEQLV